MKLDLSMYQSLKHFRKAASSRSTFRDMLFRIVQALKWKDMPPITTRDITRRNDTREMEVAWGKISTKATPQHSMRKWYLTIVPMKPA
jgi:hypothetical protein